MIDQEEIFGVQFVEEPDDGTEIGSIDPREVQSVVLNSTDWTTETILSQLRRGNIDLNPRFQRRDAWTLPKKGKFIESLILGLPVPQLVLAEKQGQRGKYLVLDGKQRLLALLQFFGEARGKNNGFRLTGLDVRMDLNGKRMEEIQGNFLLQGDIDALLNQTIRTVVVREWPSHNFLHMLFLRLNTSTVPLSPQELRQALFPGPFVDFIDDRSGTSTPLKRLLHITEPDFRMRDVELLLRFLAFHYFLDDYAGSLKTFLDTTCQRLNTNWKEQRQNVEDAVCEFENALQVGFDIHGTDGFGQQWTENGYQGRLNRAILDVQLFYLSQPTIRQAALEYQLEVEIAFKELCIRDAEFRQVVSSTTKSLSATLLRLQRFGEAIAAVLPVSVAIPEWDQRTGRILRMRGAE